jgi:hypothetical protein
MQKITNNWNGTMRLPERCMEDIDVMTVEAWEKKRALYLQERYEKHYKPKGTFEDYVECVTMIYL